MRYRTFKVPAPLTPRQLVTIALYANGVSLPQIGEILGSRPSTVKGNVRLARRRMGASAGVPRVLLAEAVEAHVTAHPTVPSSQQP
ncbi:MAG: hypothetical protein R2715_25230 [Ilumatobacteraceae bacterium]|nr:hypothetical protein [Microbacteriaceae bacterium]